MVYQGTFLKATVLMAVLCLFSVGCKKEDLNNRNNGNWLGSTRSAGSDCAAEVGVECDMLSFSDAQHFQQVYDCLEQAYEAHLNDFESNYGYLSDEDYEIMADNLGFIDEEPLLDFENTNAGIVSYRRYMADLEDQFLQMGGHPSNNPANFDLFDDDVMATLMNEHGAVMINGTIYAIDSAGNQFSFCDCSAYQDWLIDPASVVLNAPCAVELRSLYYGNNTSCMNDFWQYCDDEYVSDEDFAWWRLWFRYIAWLDYTSTTARIKNYKKKSNGNWKLRRTDLLARTFGINSSTECVHLNNYFAEVARKRKVLTATYRFPLYEVGAFQNEEAEGYWEYPGHYVSMKLDFVNLNNGDENCP